MKKVVKIILLILLILLIIYFNYVTKINNKENMENIFLHGGPDTNSSDNHSKMDNLTQTNHNIRKSITGKFIEYGPPGAKESYDFNIKTCNCPPFKGPIKNNIKTSSDYSQVYPKRLSTTAMFMDDGPLPNNEYNYDSFVNGCDCPKCGSV
tara:strand:+ start:234 stop:686 length:453 start_codon:yes stop_codon:yes gene_type:complete